MGNANEGFEERSDSDIDDLVRRFERMLESESSAFFDGHELEEIVEYYIDGNNSKRAFQAIDFALSRFPFATFFMLRQAQLLAVTNQTHKALEVLSRAENLEPGSDELFMTKGGIYSQMGLTDQAIENYRKALEYTEVPDEVYLNMAFEFENTGKTEDAIYSFINIVLFECGI